MSLSVLANKIAESLIQKKAEYGKGVDVPYSEADEVLGHFSNLFENYLSGMTEKSLSEIFEEEKLSPSQIDKAIELGTDLDILYSTQDLSTNNIDKAILEGKNIKELMQHNSLAQYQMEQLDSEQAELFAPHVTAAKPTIDPSTIIYNEAEGDYEGYDEGGRLYFGTIDYAPHKMNDFLDSTKQVYPTEEAALEAYEEYVISNNLLDWITPEEYVEMMEYKMPHSYSDNRDDTA